MNQENRTGSETEPVDVTGEDFIEIEGQPADTPVAAEVTDVVGRPGEEEIRILDEIDELDELTADTSVIDAGFATPAVPESVQELAEEVLEDISPTGDSAYPQGSGSFDADETTVLTPDGVGETTEVVRKSLFDPTAAAAQSTVVFEQVDVTGPQPDPFPPTGAQNLDATILEGATILPEVPSRAPSRWLSAIAYLLLTPLAWYLLADAGGRFLIAADSPWTTGQLNIAALGEFVGGVALVILLGVVAANSSLGLYIVGTLVATLGVPFLFAPGFTARILTEYVVPPLSRLGGLGNNFAYYLEFTGATGILFTVGVGMVVAGWVVTSVRRRGRREESLRIEVTEVNPDGLHARWARKASGIR